MLYKKKKKLRPNDVLVRPTEKVSRTSATSGKNESRALSFVDHETYTDIFVMGCMCRVIYNINCSTNDSKSSGLNAEKGKWSHLWAKLQCYLLCTHLIYLPSSASLHLQTHILSGHRMSNLISLTLHITAAMASVCKLDAVLFYSRK